ncbi:MAG: tRNA pseudouridine(38-40) synthase TruA [Verrucomicrobia bacterium]|nr:tRNA pseudouridine(38-40) synthase TruA [Verrucomicrobiota bacterium]
MVTCKLTLAYDGTDYAGWQVQPNGTAVQEVVERAIEKVFGVKARVHGSGRTDAGVHALGQVAHFQMPKARATIPPKNLRRVLNGALPGDVRVLKAEIAPEGFHARFSAKEKTYRYQIFCGEVMDPFLRRWATHWPRPLDVAAMRRAARVLMGRHDFAAFSANPQREQESTVRTLKRLSVASHGEVVTITATADGFLYKMVRSLAGALLKVGAGKLKVEDIERILASKQRTAIVETAPPQGLFLVRVRY